MTKNQFLYGSLVPILMLVSCGKQGNNEENGDLEKGESEISVSDPLDRAIQCVVIVGTTVSGRKHRPDTGELLTGKEAEEEAAFNDVRDKDTFGKSLGASLDAINAELERLGNARGLTEEQLDAMVGKEAVRSINAAPKTEKGETPSKDEYEKLVRYGKMLNSRIKDCVSSY